MEVIALWEDYIKLGQALKAAGLVESGVEAKIVIQEGEVMVNGETEFQRGKKLYDGDIVSFRGEEIRIVKTDSEIEKCTVTKGDLLVCEGGDIGRSAIWMFDNDIRIQNHIHRLRPYISLSNRFYYYNR